MAEHPRASTTDDVECFFSVLRDMVGKDFTHKQVTKTFIMITLLLLLTLNLILLHAGDVWLAEGN